MRRRDVNGSPPQHPLTLIFAIIYSLIYLLYRIVAILKYVTVTVDIFVDKLGLRRLEVEDNF